MHPPKKKLRKQQPHTLKEKENQNSEEEDQVCSLTLLSASI